MPLHQIPLKAPSGSAQRTQPMMWAAEPGDSASASVIEEARRALRTLMNNTGAIEGSAVVTSDGLPVVTVFPQGTDEDRVAAMAAALLSFGEGMAADLRRGEVQQVYVRGTAGLVLVQRVKEDVLLQVIVGAEAKLGLILLELKRATQELARVL